MRGTRCRCCSCGAAPILLCCSIANRTTCTTTVWLAGIFACSGQEGLDVVVQSALKHWQRASSVSRPPSVLYAPGRASGWLASAYVCRHRLSTIRRRSSLRPSTCSRPSVSVAASASCVVTNEGVRPVRTLSSRTCARRRCMRGGNAAAATSGGGSTNCQRKSCIRAPPRSDWNTAAR